MSAALAAALLRSFPNVYAITPQVLKKFGREFEINVWVILIATSLKNSFQIHSILIGDKKTQLFRGINSDYF